MPYSDNVTFTITCTMRPRWIPQFLGMLRHMQVLGAQGSSRNVTIFADGDGDFRPRFDWKDLPDPAPAFMLKGDDAFFDAG